MSVDVPSLYITILTHWCLYLFIATLVCALANGSNVPPRGTDKRQKRQSESKNDKNFFICKVFCTFAN